MPTRFSTGCSNRSPPDLHAWGFNSVGWTQEVVTRGLTNHRHSRAFTFEEYQWLGLPYCHLLPFADFHQWDVEVRNPDFSSPEFAEWCDYVARACCARMKDDPKLIGYFYIDCQPIPGTRTDYGCLRNFDGRPGFPGRSLRPTILSRRSTNVALPKG